MSFTLLRSFRGLLFVIVISLFPAWATAGQSQGGFPFTPDQDTDVVFLRTFNGNGTDREHDWCARAENRREAIPTIGLPGPAGGTKNLSLAITYADFELHLGAGQDRTIMEINREGGIPMNVGGEDVTDGFWVMPDFGNYLPVIGGIILSEEVATTPYPGDHPGATHSFYSPGLNQYEYFELFEGDGSGNGALFFLGSSDADFIYESNTIQAPVPMQLGLGVFGGEEAPIDCADLDGGCEGYPTADYIIRTEMYEEVAAGTLSTYDNGPSEALKLRHTTQVVVYEVDGTPVDTFYLDDIIFYSKAGHYIIAELADGAPWAGETSFTRITYHKVANQVLPVDWLNFTAQIVEKNKVDLNWSTAAETDSDRFTVERSNNGITFTTIGEVAGNGTTNSISDYDFTDAAPESGTNYYRVRQVDFSGESTLSDVVTVLLSEATGTGEATVLVYPNPGRNEVNFSRPADFELFSSNGQLMTRGRAEGTINVSDLPPGVYGIRIDGGETHRWIKNK